MSLQASEPYPNFLSDIKCKVGCAGGGGGLRGDGGERLVAALPRPLPAQGRRRRRRLGSRVVTAGAQAAGRRRHFSSYETTSNLRPLAADLVNRGRI